MEPFWYDDFSVLYDARNLTKFYPNKTLSLVEKLNASVRLSIYFSILLFLYKGNSAVFYIPVATLLVTYYVWNKQPPKELHFDEAFNGSAAVNQLKPSYDNPFMNPNLIVPDPKTFLQKAKKQVKFDVNHHIDTKEDIQIKEAVEDKFDARLYQSVGDVFNKENSQRQFYHVPSRTFPNDQTAFAKWCWGVDKTCKAGDSPECLLYDDELRGHAAIEDIRATGPSSVTLRKDWF